jgi:hypothetical protein
VIDKTSRYANAPSFTVVDGTGRTLQGVELRDIPPTDGTFSALPSPADRLDLLAFKFYRDARRFWRIADAADELDPFLLVQSGVPLLIPPDK